MKKKDLMRMVLLAAAVITAGTALGVGLSRIAAARRQTGMRPPTVVSQSSAVDDRPLADKAKRDGHVTELMRPDRSKVYNDLSELAAASGDVVIGIPKENLTSLTPDGKSVVITYQVEIQHVYKGSLQKGATIPVTLPGGRISFPDGSMAEIKTPWFKKMQDGKAYALFLQQKTRGSKFEIVGQAQGVFEIPTTRQDRTVKSHVGILNDPMWKYHGMDVSNFIPELRKATGASSPKAKS